MYIAGVVPAVAIRSPTMSDAKENACKVLESIVKDKFPDASNVKIKPVSSAGANYSSVLFEISVITQNDTQELFAKVASMGDALNNSSKLIFSLEKFVLTTLSSAYEILQDKYGIPERFQFPKFYGNNHDDGIPVAVMENLAAQGYECYDRFKIIEWNYASKSVEALAKFHALSFALNKEYPEQFKNAGEVLKLPNSIYESPEWEGIDDAAMSALDEEDKNILSRLLEGTVGWGKLLDLCEPRKTSVIIHGDYRASNLMHKVVNGEYHVIPVDYPTARLGCPVADLLYFIVLGSDQQFRKQYYHQLVNHYYEHLALMMTKFGLKPEKIYGKEEFESDIKAKLPSALSVAAMVLPYITVDPASAPNFESGQFVPRANELFVERFRGLMQDMKQWGVI